MHPAVKPVQTAGVTATLACIFSPPNSVVCHPKPKSSMTHV